MTTPTTTATPSVSATRTISRSIAAIALAAAAVLGSTSAANGQLFNRPVGDGQIATSTLALDDGYSAYEAGRFEEAARAFQQHADNGDFNAQYMLGLMYHTGQGVERDTARAAGLYDKAASRGHVAAACNLGLLLRDGDGVKPDFEHARNCLRWAALRENVPAQIAFGSMLFEGKGGDESQVDGLAWWTIAAEKDEQAQLLLDKHGKGLTQDSHDRIETQVDAIVDAVDQIRREDIRDRAVRGELEVAWDMGLVIERHAAGWIVTGYDGDGYDFADESTAPSDELFDGPSEPQASADTMYIAVEDEGSQNAFAKAMPVGTIITAALGHDLSAARNPDEAKVILSYDELALEVLRPDSACPSGWAKADVTIKRAETPSVDELGDESFSRSIFIRNVWIETETPEFARQQRPQASINGLYRQ